MVVAALVGCADAPPRDTSEETLRISLEEWTVPASGAAGEPWLSTGEDGVVLSWLEATPGGHALRAGRVGAGGVRSAATVVESADFFVNWADIPMVTQAADGRWFAHVLERGGEGTYDYRILATTSDDDGATWSPLRPVHTDATPTEHGFVSHLPEADGAMGVVWLDGRRFVDGPEGPATEHMTLRYRTLRPDGSWADEELLDSLVCDCCQTGVARTERGWAVAYRDRTAGEIRDIHVGRFEGGRWIAGQPVHADGWVMPACPVNGPAVAASGDEVAVVWYTAADDQPRVQLAFSSDGGATFGAPVRIDQGDPVGRADVVVDDGGGAWVLWMEGRGEGAEVRLRRVHTDGVAGPWGTVVTTERARTAGFPRLVRWPAGGLLVAWTHPDGEGGRVRLAHLDPGAPTGDARGP